MNTGFPLSKPSNYWTYTGSDQSAQALLGRETLRRNEIGRAIAEVEVTRARQTVVVVHLHSGGVQHLEDSEVASSIMKRSPPGQLGFKNRTRNPVTSPLARCAILNGDPDRAAAFFSASSCKRGWFA
jgi:hypothetical protein